MMKKEDKTSVKLTSSQLRKLIREEFAKGIPDYAAAIIAENCKEEVKRILVNYVIQKSSDSTTQRALLAKTNITLKSLEKNIKDVIEQHLRDFIYNI